MRKIDWFTDANGVRYTLDKQKCGIYKITNPLGQVYVGQSTNIMKRVVGHKCNKKTSSRIAKSIIEFGFDNHIFGVLEFCQKGELKARERHWQDLLESDGENGLNIMLTKTESKKGKGQLRQIEAMRKANTGSIKTGMHSEEFKDRQRKRLKGNCLNPHHNKRSVIQFSKKGEYIKEWPSLFEACVSLGINVGNTGECANGNRLSSGGYKWKYKIDYEKA